MRLYKTVQKFKVVRVSEGAANLVDDAGNEYILNVNDTLSAIHTVDVTGNKYEVGRLINLLMKIGFQNPPANSEKRGIILQ